MSSITISPVEEKAGKRPIKRAYPSIKSDCPGLDRDLYFSSEDNEGNETTEHFLTWPILQGAVHERRVLSRGYSTLQTNNYLASHGACVGYELFRVTSSNRYIHIGLILWIDGKWERILSHCPAHTKVSCFWPTGDRFEADDIGGAIWCCLDKHDSLDEWLEGLNHAA